MSTELTGRILTNSFPGECGEAEELLRKILESARVVFPGISAGQIVVSDTAPGPDDRDKAWLNTENNGLRWFAWSTKCGEWCQLSGAPGELLTRYRINATVAEDIEAYYPCGYQLADGSNLLGVDKLEVINIDGVYFLSVTPSYAVSSVEITDNADNATTYNITPFETDTIANQVIYLNAQFTSGSVPAVADVNAFGELTITPDTATDTVTAVTGPGGNLTVR